MRGQRRPDPMSRCQGVIAQLRHDRVIPDPFGLTEFITRLERRRGRRIRLEPVTIARTVPWAPCGVLVSTTTSDRIYFTCAMSGWHRTHIAVHEIGHLLLDHPGHPAGAIMDVLAALMPRLDPRLIVKVLGRSLRAEQHGVYRDEHEREAENFATRLLAARLPRTRHRTALKSVYPLWSALTQAVPQVVLDAQPHHDPAFQLHRLLVEISDVLCLLSPYRSAETAARAATAAGRSGLAGERAAAVIEAAVVAEALRTHRQGGDPVSPACECFDPARQHHLTLRDEARWYALLARALMEHADAAGTGGPTAVPTRPARPRPLTVIGPAACCEGPPTEPEPPSCC